MGDHRSLPRVRVLQLLLGVTTRGYLDSNPVLQPLFRDGLAQWRCWTVPLWDGHCAEGQPAWLGQVPAPRSLHKGTGRSWILGGKDRGFRGWAERGCSTASTTLMPSLTVVWLSALSLLSCFRTGTSSAGSQLGEAAPH